MIESGYYPPGAEFDPKAPYNQEEIPERCFDVLISQTLSKTTVVSTRDYIPEYEEEDGHTYADTSETDWEKAYSHSWHYTPIELIREFKGFLTKHLPDPIVDIKGFREFKHLIDECENWTEDETEVIYGRS